MDFFVELTKIKHCKRLTKVCGCALVVFDVSSHPAGIVFDRTRGKVRSVVGVEQPTIKLLGVALGQHKGFGGSSVFVHH